jgi:myo-inositol 2-dehydrogenase/D-chiro-inositol 1-dehydrogenase
MCAVQKRRSIYCIKEKTMETHSVSRRKFLCSGTIAGASASTITILRPELVRGAGKEELKIGLVGCGGRGTQAVADHLTGNENTVLVTMGDVFEDKLEASYKRLQTDPRLAALQSRIKVDPEHRFTGFDAYRKVIASGVDIVMLCTPPGYRPMHFEAAVEARKHVFTEKPVGTDPVGVRRFMAAVKKSEQWKLTIMAGAQRRVVARVRGYGAEDSRWGDRRNRGGQRLVLGHAGI